MQESLVILGLSVGTRRIGFAVLQGSAIRNRKVSAFKGAWSAKKLRLIMRRIDKEILNYPIQGISLKVPVSSHHTTGLKCLIAEIKSYCAIKGLRIHICTIDELKSHGITEGRRNKKALVQALAHKYQSLQNRAKREQASRNSYHTQMFEAIAAAELLQEQIK